MVEPRPLSEDEFWAIYRKVPRLTVEIVVLADNGSVLLTKRAIDPCRGLWHLPGGTVRFGESLADAVTRIADNELGLTLHASRLLGHIEYPSHYRNGLDHPVGIAFEAVGRIDDVTLNAAASEYGWFRELPSTMHDEQRGFVTSRVTPPARSGL